MTVDKLHTMEELVDKMASELENPAEIRLDGLNERESAELAAGLARVRELAELARGKGLKLLVDAEYTYMNPGISCVALALMVVYNRGQVVVGNTYQCYLKVRSLINCSLEIYNLNG